MSKFAKRTAVAALIVGIPALASFTAQAAPTEAHRCVPLMQVDETPVIDDKTILIKLKGGEYKRVDLVAACAGLKMRSGFAHKTWTNDICTSDAVKVVEPAGATCMIDKIVDINKDEAKKLLANR